MIRFLFAAIYLTVDLIYVVLSKTYYERYAARIQGKGFPSGRLMGGVLSYAALVIGWWFFATRLADELAKRFHHAVAGAMAGALYGFVVYAVFNGTMYVMFENYDHRVLARDLMWGVISATTITSMYMIARKAYRYA